MSCKDPEKNKQNHRTYYLAHKAEINQKEHKYYQAHKQELAIIRQKNYAQIKLEVYRHYSSGTPKCVICGETDLRVLTIDHINDDGAKQRKIEGNGKKLYHWLKKNDFPEGFQILCRNCNYRKYLIYSGAS